MTNPTYEWVIHHPQNFNSAMRYQTEFTGTAEAAADRLHDLFNRDSTWGRMLCLQSRHTTRPEAEDGVALTCAGRHWVTLTWGDADAPEDREDYWHVHRDCGGGDEVLAECIRRGVDALVARAAPPAV